ncbi:hypothetical protein D9M71_550890 [compost metagenome]
MRTLQARQQFKATARQLLCGKDRRDWRLRIEHCIVVTQQPFEIVPAKRLPRVFSDAPVMGHDKVAQLRRHLLAIGTGHHPAPVYHHRQQTAGGADQRLGAIAPAAQGVENIVKGGLHRHSGLRDSKK